MTTPQTFVEFEPSATNPLHVFHEGDYALLIDRQDRRYLFRLEMSGTFHTHFGVLKHSYVIGSPIGSRIDIQGHKLLAIKPTLSEFIHKSPRSTQMLYPKDLGAIFIHADIFPGAKVFEAGLGSGVLTLMLLRAVGKSGLVISYEIKADLISETTKNIGPLVLNWDNLEIHNADAYEGIPNQEFDRVLLDLPEPWRVVIHAGKALVPGGIIASFSPTVLQVHQFVDSLNQNPYFDLIETFEVIERPWHVTQRSVRPEHNMVAHTGFITIARKCALKETKLQGSKLP